MAAEKNNLSQPNLSRNIKILEENLNLKLVNTNNKGFKLTLEGEKLFKQLDEVFNNLKNNNDESEGLIGKIKIGTTRSIADNRILEYISQFNKKYPQVEIKIVTDNASNLNMYLAEHSIDVLIDYLPHINYSEKYNFEVITIGKFNTCFACSKEFYKKNGKKIQTFKDLNKYNLVVPGSSKRRQILEQFLQERNLSIKAKIEMPDSKLMIDFIKNNDYIGYFIEDEIKDNELVKLDLIEKMPVNSYALIYPTNIMNNVTKKFVELVVEKIPNWYLIV